MDCLYGRNAASNDRPDWYTNEVSVDGRATMYDQEFRVHKYRPALRRRLARDSMVIYSEQVCLMHRRRRREAMRARDVDSRRRATNGRFLQRISVSEQAGEPSGSGAGLALPRGGARVSVSENDAVRRRTNAVGRETVAWSQRGANEGPRPPTEIAGVLTGDPLGQQTSNAVSLTTSKLDQESDGRVLKSTKDCCQRVAAVPASLSTSRCDDIGDEPVRGNSCATRPVPQDGGTALAADSKADCTTGEQGRESRAELEARLQRETRELLRDAIKHLQRVQLAKGSHDEMLQQINVRWKKTTPCKRKPTLDDIPEHRVTNAVSSHRFVDVGKPNSRTAAQCTPVDTSTSGTAATHGNYVTGYMLVGDSCTLNRLKEDGAKTTNGGTSGNPRQTDRDNKRGTVAEQKSNDRTPYGSVMNKRDMFKCKTLQTFADRKNRFRRLKYLKDT